MNLLNIIKLAKVLTKLEAISTDKGIVIADTLEIGSEVYMENDGNTEPAKNGDYMLEDKRVMVVKDGKIEEIKDAPANEETTPAEEAPKTTDLEEVEKPKDEEKKECMEGEANNAELENRIKELEADVANRDAIIAEANDKIKALEEEIAKIKGEPVEEKMATIKPKAKFPFKTYKF